MIDPSLAVDEYVRLFNERIDSWTTAKDFTHVIAHAPLQNVCITDNKYTADTVCFESVDCFDVGAVILMDGNGTINQWQVPVLGMAQEGETMCLCLTGFCLLVDDLVTYQELEPRLSKSDPCEIVCKLEDCLLELALNKEAKSAFAMDNMQMSFRALNIPLIEKLIERYTMRCKQKFSCRPLRTRRFRFRC